MNIEHQRVSDHYEKYPYPTYGLWAQGRYDDTKRLDLRTWHVQRPIRDLWISGCGTIAPLMFAKRNPMTKILATDLSSKSLRRAWLRLRLFGYWNVSLRQEDLLDSQAHEAFDAIDAYGVIHHTVDPALSLHKLAAALRPGGVMRVMLYSKKARKDIEEMRVEVFRRNLTTISELKAYLKEKGIERFGDLASTAGLADALLHPLVRTYDSKELRDLLESCSALELLRIDEKANFVCFLRKK